MKIFKWVPISNIDKKKLLKATVTLLGAAVAAHAAAAGDIVSNGGAPNNTQSSAVNTINGASAVLAGGVDSSNKENTMHKSDATANAANICNNNGVNSNSTNASATANITSSAAYGLSAEDSNTCFSMVSDSQGEFVSNMAYSEDSNSQGSDLLASSATSATKRMKSSTD